jgi:Ca2+-binding RTX toxin-like protein
MTGSNFADTFRGGLGADVLSGLGNNDTFQIAGSEGVGDSFNGGAGVDRIQVLGTASASLAGFNAAAAQVEQWIGNGKGLFGTATANNFDFAGLGAKTGLPFVDGGAGNDTIIGSNLLDDLRGNIGADVLNGLGANDLLTGGLGKDMMTGGVGADRFDFNAFTESAKGGYRDVITDFNRAQGDKIDLSTIDADIDGTPGNQAFKFIGAFGFTGVDGQLRCSAGVVQGDLNGDRIADFEIKVNVATLLGSDFIL